MTDILALDIATTIGWARGRVGEQPISGTLDLGTTTVNRPFGDALRELTAMLQPEPRPDLLMLEAMLAPSIMRGETNHKTYMRLAGLHGVVRAVADCLHIGETATASIGDVRAHFISDRFAPSKEAKFRTVLRCEQLGWRVKDHNAADALAVWSYACALINPQLALRVVPLFNRNAVHVADLDLPGTRRSTRDPLA